MTARTIIEAVTTKIIDSIAYVPATLLLFSTQLNAQSVDADGFPELNPVSVLQSDVAESNNIIPIDKKIAIEMKIATNPINDICSTMVITTMQN